MKETSLKLYLLKRFRKYGHKSYINTIIYTTLEL